jgi:hypothetical protein
LINDEPVHRRWPALVLAAAAILAGCAAHDDYLKAQSAGTLQAWSDYVKKYPPKEHPNCEDCQAAQKSLDAALAKEKDDWTTAQNAGTAAAYLDFLSNRASASPYYESAQSALIDLLKKGQAEEGDYLAYLNKRPDDAKASEVRRALLIFRYGKAKAAPEPGAAAYFESQYPGTSEAAKLAPHWAAKEFEKAKAARSRLALEFYLKRFPDSARAGEAQSLLAGYPHADPIADNGEAIELLPKYRQVSAALRGQECIEVMAGLIRATGDPYGAAAEKIRGDFSSAASPSDIDACRDAEMRVPNASRALVGAAVRSLVALSQRRARLGSLFSGPEQVAGKARNIGRTASQLSEASEAFDLEMQAYYGYMPADPDNPKAKASKDAAEAVRRAKRAFDLTSGGAVASKKKEAAETIDLMNAQEELLVKVIAYHEKPERRAQ